MVFAAENALGDPSLWSTSGTAEGTAEIFDPCPDPCDGAAAIDFLGSSEALTYFITLDLPAGPGRRNLYRTDGTAEGTFPLLPAAVALGLPSGATQDAFALSGSRLFFRLQQGFDQAIWATTGTPESTTAVFAPSATSSGSTASLCAFDDHALFFHWTVETEGAWLYRIGTHPLKISSPISSGGLDFICLSTRIVQDSLLIPARDVLGEYGLWTANAVSGSLTRIAGSSTEPRVVESDGTVGLFLTWVGADLLPSLWSTDGTESGTRLLKTGTRFESFPYEVRADQFARTGDQIFYLYRTDDDAIELRRITRQGDGDLQVASICATGCGGNRTPYFVELLGDDIVASSDSPPFGTGLYRFVAGSAQSDEVQIPCSTPCAPDHSVAHLDGSLIFTVEGDSAGLDLWRLPLYSASANRVTDFDLITAPSPEVLELEELELLNGRLYLSSRENGHEPPLPFAVALASPCEGLTGRVTCLGGERFRVGVRWREFAGGSGTGLWQSFTDNSGYSYFFDAANIELMVKIVDGTVANGYFWVYYGALSNVEYWITIEDTVTGAVREYHNPLGAFGSFGDIEALPASSGAAGGVPPFTRRNSQQAQVAAFGSPTCFPSSTRVCLLDGRFAVEGVWEDFEGESGVAFAEPLTTDTGYLWFFDPGVAEILVKLVDGGGFNDHFWVYYGSLSNVEFTLYVTDTETGETRPYFNALGSFGSFGDIEAFPAD